MKKIVWSMTLRTKDTCIGVKDLSFHLTQKKWEMK
jgi:hypothetical protein